MPIYYVVSGIRNISVPYNEIIPLFSVPPPPTHAQHTDFSSPDVDEAVVGQDFILLSTER